MRRLSLTLIYIFLFMSSSHAEIESSKSLAEFIASQAFAEDLNFNKQELTDDELYNVGRSIGFLAAEIEKFSDAEAPMYLYTEGFYKTKSVLIVMGECIEKGAELPPRFPTLEELRGHYVSSVGCTPKDPEIIDDENRPFYISLLLMKGDVNDLKPGDQTTSLVWTNEAGWNGYVRFKGVVGDQVASDESVNSKNNPENPEKGVPALKMKHILVKTKREAEAVIAIATPENFATLAKTMSIGPSASEGGDLGWVVPSAMIPEFEKIALSTPVGEIAQIAVPSNFGWHVIFVEEKNDNFIANAEANTETPPQNSEPGFLGIRLQSITKDIADSVGMVDGKGVLVAGVLVGDYYENFPLQVGDVITHLNGVLIENIVSYNANLASMKAGQVVSVDFVRQRMKQKIEISLSSRDPVSGKLVKYSPPSKSTDQIQFLGMTLRNIDSKLRSSLKIPVKVNGVAIVLVNSGSEPDRKEIASGAVITEIAQEAIQNLEDFNSKISKLKSEGRKNVLLMLASPPGTDDWQLRFVSLRIDGGN